MAFLKAVIFGSIGTLTETSEMQRNAFNQAFADGGHAIKWDPQTYRALVSGNRATVGGNQRIRIHAAAAGIDLDEGSVAALHDAKSRHFQAAMERDGLALNAGVEAFIADARKAGLAIALASTTSRSNVLAMLGATRPSIAECFDVVLSGDDVEFAKPAPDIYLLALQKLQLDASEVIAIEDSAPSMAAALSAGIATFAVPGVLWDDASFDGATAVLPSLDAMTVAQLGDRLGRDLIQA